MRNPDRRIKLLKLLAEVWLTNKYEDLRLCQLIRCVVSYDEHPPNDLYYLEDDVLIAALEGHLEAPKTIY